MQKFGLADSLVVGDQGYRYMIIYKKEIDLYTYTNIYTLHIYIRV